MIYIDEIGLNQFNDIISDIHNKINKNNIDKKEAMEDAPGDGWHDNFAAEHAAREERMLLDELERLLKEKNKLEVIKVLKHKDKVNLNDYVTIKFIYDKFEEIDTIMLTGKYRPEKDYEITLNSPVGKSIYKKKLGYKKEIEINSKLIKIEVLKISDKM